MICNEAEPGQLRWSESLVSKHDCKGQQENLASSTAASYLGVFYSKNLSKTQRRSCVLCWCSSHSCPDFWCCPFGMGWGVMMPHKEKILLEDVGAEVSGIYFHFLHRKLVGIDGCCCLSHALPATAWLQGLPFTYFPAQCIDVLLSLPFWAVCFLLMSRGSPKGLFCVLLQGEEHRAFLTLPRRKVKSLKKTHQKQLTHKYTQTFITQSLLALNRPTLFSVLNTVMVCDRATL